MSQIDMQLYNAAMEKLAALGGLQASYVADAAGADASERANTLAGDKAREDEDSGLIDDIFGQAADAGRMINKRKRHGAAAFAENDAARLLNVVDPSRLITDGSPDATLTGLAMVSGKKDKDREARVLDQYKDIIKKYQDPVEMDGDKTTRETPWHLLMQGEQADVDMDVAGHKQQRKEHPLNYWLNPVDRTGPVNELLDRWRRRMGAAVAEPDSAMGRFGMGAGNVATLGLLGALAGDKDAQNKLRRSAVANKIYGEESMPKGADKPKDGDGDGKVNDGTSKEKEAMSYEKSAKGRCWDGYEPVPGKKAYSDGSCQPAGSKKKKKKSEKSGSSTAGLQPGTEEFDDALYEHLYGKKREKKKSEKAAEFALNTKDITKGNTAAAGALLGGGLGAGAGALQALIQRALSKKDEEEQPSILNRALMGGIAGGGAGAAGGYLGAPALQGVAKNLAGNPLAGMRKKSEKAAASCSSHSKPKKKKSKKVEKAALEIATKVAAYRRIQEKQAREVRIKLASHVLRIHHLRQELETYDPYRLSKSAAIGAHKADRLKAAALVRQIELEKQAFLGSIVGAGLSGLGRAAGGMLAGGAKQALKSGIKGVGQGARAGFGVDRAIGKAGLNAAKGLAKGGFRGAASAANMTGRGIGGAAKGMVQGARGGGGLAGAARGAIGGGARGVAQGVKADPLAGTALLGGGAMAAGAGLQNAMRQPMQQGQQMFAQGQQAMQQAPQQAMQAMQQAPQAAGNYLSNLGNAFLGRGMTGAGAAGAAPGARLAGAGAAGVAPGAGIAG